MHVLLIYETLRLGEDLGKRFYVIFKIKQWCNSEGLIPDYNWLFSAQSDLPAIACLTVSSRLFSVF